MRLDTWHDLFLGSAGAASALAGLIIVAMSVNIATILQIPSMTSRAGTTVAGLVLIVVVTCAGLVPGQPTVAFGVEIDLAAAVAAALAIRSAREIGRAGGHDAGHVLTFGKAALGIVPAVATLSAGGLLSADLRVGLYVLAAAIVTGFATATTNAWVLLVEIRR